MQTESHIQIAHGSGGLLTQHLIRDVFQKHLQSKEVEKMTDAAEVASMPGSLVVSTDSFVVSPIFFPGGDIGKLSICGTVNDVAVSGGIPQYLTAGFILEEGLLLKDLDKIVASMAAEANAAGVTIIAGDTKVVERGKGDKIFINTTGFGWMHPKAALGYHTIRPGDHILLNGTIAEHGIAILSQRDGIRFSSPVLSDAKCLHKTISSLLDNNDGIRFMRDPTRGGLATVLAEVAEAAGLTLIIDEERISIREEVAAACEILGLDPLYMANEGKFVMICNPQNSRAIIEQIINQDPASKPQIIGVVKEGSAIALMNTRYGGTRILDILPDEILPRIC